MQQSKNKKPLTIRNATIADIDRIHDLCETVYPDMPPYSVGVLTGQINNFPEGQFVAEYEGKVIGYCASLRTTGDIALNHHTWRQVTGGGYCSTHNPAGEYLYGVEVFVDPAYRGLRMGQRFYNERKKLCKYYRLKGIVFAGRMPLIYKHIKNLKTPEKYIELVKKKKIRDPIISFQIKQGFHVIKVLENYLPGDKESLGYACLMKWDNPEIKAETLPSEKPSHLLIDSVRVATVQYQQRRIESFEEFEQIVTYFVDVVSDYKSDFVLFPELFTLQLLSVENKPIPPEEAIAKLTDYTDRLKELFNQLSLKYNINIIAGSYPAKFSDGDIHNVCYIFLRDGSIYEQHKIQPTPNERYWWNIQGGDNLEVINTDCGPIGVLICYDCEFPELARHLIDQGANILFVPFCTDERQSYLRVRYAAQARAVENQCYVVMSGNVGNLPRVHNMDIQYAQSCILTPCDFPFARDGIAADTTPNVETVAFADLRLDDLSKARDDGTVQNLKDRRHDMYGVVWHRRNK